MTTNKSHTKLIMTKNNDLTPGKGGHIKHYRSLQNEPVCLEGSLLEFKLYCIMRDEANWQANSWTYEGKQYNCLPGELITSVQSLVEKLRCKRDKITARKVRVALDNLVKYGHIFVETGWQTKVIFTDKKYWQWQEKYGGWLGVGDEWLYFGPGKEEIKAYFERNKEKLALLYSNNTIYNVGTFVKTFPEFAEAKKPIDKGLPGLGASEMSKDMSRDVSTIEEVKEYIEEADQISKSKLVHKEDLSTDKKEKDAAAIIQTKENEEAGASPDIHIVNLYHKLRKEYHLNDQVVNIHKDMAILKKSENRTMIIDDGPAKVDRKIRGWFDNTGDKNYEWKKDNNFPFAAFCKQYYSIREVEPERIVIGMCGECGKELLKGRAHKCTHIVVCDECNTAVSYEGKKRDEEILQWHCDKHGCNAPES